MPPNTMVCRGGVRALTLRARRAVKALGPHVVMLIDWDAYEL